MHITSARLFAKGIGTLWVFFVAAVPAMATTTNMTSTATVVVPVTTTAQQALRFGSFVGHNTDGTLTVHPDGTRTATGGVVLMSSTDFGPARFSFIAEPGSNVGLTLPDAVYVTGPAGEQMRLHNFTIGPRTGLEDALIGCTVDVEANQAAGEYSATVPLTAHYE